MPVDSSACICVCLLGNGLNSTPTFMLRLLPKSWTRALRRLANSPLCVVLKFNLRHCVRCMGAATLDHNMSSLIKQNKPLAAGHDSPSRRQRSRSSAPACLLPAAAAARLGAPRQSQVRDDPPHGFYSDRILIRRIFLARVLCLAHFSAS